MRTAELRTHKDFAVCKWGGKEVQAGWPTVKRQCQCFLACNKEIHAYSFQKRHFTVITINFCFFSKIFAYIYYVLESLGKIFLEFHTYMVIQYIFRIPYMRRRHFNHYLLHPLTCILPMKTKAPPQVHNFLFYNNFYYHMYICLYFLKYWLKYWSYFLHTQSYFIPRDICFRNFIIKFFSS